MSDKIWTVVEVEYVGSSININPWYFSFKERSAARDSIKNAWDFRVGMAISNIELTVAPHVSYSFTLECINEDTWLGLGHEVDAFGNRALIVQYKLTATVISARSLSEDEI